MKIAIGSDHGGYNLKQTIKKYLNDKNITFFDFGTDSDASCDYAPIAFTTCEAVINGDYDYAVLVCGTGVGISIAANKVKGIRAACCSDTFSARMTRLHNNANVLCLGERVTGAGLAVDITGIFLNTPFEGGRHLTRINQIKDYEKALK